MLYALLVAGAVVCAFQALRSSHLLPSAIWLAGVSALTAITLYAMGAHEVAVIELSVGAGLVTVLFVFAISIAGDDAMDARSLLPKPLAIGLIVLFAAVAGIMILPTESKEISVETDSFTNILWSARSLDVLVQIVLIFTGVLCMLGLLSEVRVPVKQRERVNVESLLSPSTGNGHHHEPAEEDSPLEEIHA